MKRFDMEIQPQQYYMGEGESYAVSPYESTNGEWVRWDDVSVLEASHSEMVDLIKQFIDVCENAPATEWMYKVASLVEPMRNVLNNIEGQG